MTLQNQNERNEDRNSLISQSAPSKEETEFEFSGEHFFEISQRIPSPPRLSLPLMFLFGMNGATLALPTTALMFILNTRVSMALTLIPTYAAIAFLPYSLKPLYAFLSIAMAPRHRRHLVITLLLLLSGLCTAGTALIPVDGVWACILFGFVRGVTGAWPEFLLGLTLVDQARNEQPVHIYAETAALFQAQAATARNIGALVAHAAVTVFFVVQELNDGSVTFLLFAAGLLNCISALVAWSYRVGSTRTPVLTTENHAEESPVDSLTRLPRPTSYDSFSDCNCDCESLLSPCRGSGPSDATHRNIRIVVLLQWVIILFSLRGPIEEVISTTAWGFMAAGAIFALAVTGCASPSVRWERSHRVGLFLILRHAMPSVSNIMSSYFYSLFSSMPAFLQAMSLTDMFVTTVASWSYGRVLSQYSKEEQLYVVIAGTTVFASVASLGNLLLVKYCTPDSTWLMQVCLAIGVKTITTWTGEWNFLPDVILATISAVPAHDSQAVPEDDSQENSQTTAMDPTTTTPTSPDAATLTASTNTSDGGTETITTATPTEEYLAGGDDSQKVDMQYGTLVSCIDFGDQLGALLAGPIVAALGISRENDWAGMDTLIQLSSLAALLSIGFIAILR
jgi:hypothetical protein